VEHRDEADASAEMLGIGRDRERGLGRGFEQQVVDHRLVLIGDVGDLRRQCVHHMKVRHREEIGLARGQPLPGGCALALRAVPVAATVVRDLGVRALLAARDMAAERRVRQRSIALMTFNWPRLTWPALARRHAAPWSRKISATSSAGRDTAPTVTPAAGPFLLFLGLLRGCDSVERALDAGDHAGGDTGIARRRVQFVVTQQRLDDLISVPSSSRWVAKLWRSACSVRPS